MTALSTEPLLTVVPVAPETAPAAPSRLRLVPVPPSAPPYDDEPGPRPLLQLVMEPIAPPPVIHDDDAWLAASRTPTAQLPPAGVFARTLVQGLLEVLAGVRPVKQLQRDTAPELYSALAVTVTRRGYRTGARPDGNAVRSLHVQARPEGVAEVCATVVRGRRYAAVALRLEGLDGRWRCTELTGV